MLFSTLNRSLSGIFLFCAFAVSSPFEKNLDLDRHTTRQTDAAPVGYLGAFFLGNVPNVFLYLSNGNDPLSFRPLRDGQPSIVPTLGTQGVRDPTIVNSGGADEGQKWYIIGTDLNIAKTTWDAAQRTGSLSIFVWESEDLVNWGKERLVKVEDDTAGMVWAPEAIWDSEQGQYLVYWSSRFYQTSDPGHTGTPSSSRIRYAYTSDFSTFSEPQDYVDHSPNNIIDLTFLPNGGNTYARLIKDEDAKTVFSEFSENGLFGTWERQGGSSGIIAEGVEGPAAYWDNEVGGKAHLLLDFYGGNGYVPFESSYVPGGQWTRSDAPGFPTGLRHGSVIQIHQEQYDALNSL
ncbi:hypothetical protein AJ79_04582 [Helicocarpus griseus UAMH5409]|uniref:Arabinosidase n=1 Tax=Helicocarpus griseus UAMH5409 TaxID=1447875 RepID=A0A2B7XSZ8_9EURO|nr:hypothetical protein AJ79_04582 [Helicocarpus griseus UAMH5409]